MIFFSHRWKITQFCLTQPLVPHVLFAIDVFYPVPDEFRDKIVVDRFSDTGISPQTFFDMNEQRIAYNVADGKSKDFFVEKNCAAKKRKFVEKI